jgi:carboxyl-terminal processing protease
MSNKDVTSRLKGPKGTTVTVRVQRRGVPDLLSFNIVRDKIPIYSIDATYMVDKSTGYIRIIRFGATTTDEFRNALKKLKNQGMENLMLDLEYNGGGYMSPAIDIADDFLDAGKLIVYTEGLRQPRRDEVSTAKGEFEKGRLVVLIDEGSASASEILSGAVQDWDRGLIVGRRSFGKGLVQRQIPLPDESMIRLTIARYYTPTGRSIQKPYVKGDLTSYNMDVIQRYNKGEMMHADSIHFPDSLKYTTMANHRTVYGGGGIMPDCFVPADTTFLSDYYKKIYGRNITFRIAYNEIDNHRNEIKKDYPTAGDFLNNYDVPEEIMNRMIALGKEEKIGFDEEGYNKSKDVFKRQIKAYIGRDVYDTETMVRIFNEDSETFKKAYGIIGDDKLYNDLLKGKHQ